MIALPFRDRPKTGRFRSSGSYGSGDRHQCDRLWQMPVIRRGLRIQYF
ncbi:hypothetical protein [Oscillatoria acuminata]|nr:hypothetical protein [Oscillatoria acuminata]